MFPVQSLAASEWRYLSEGHSSIVFASLHTHTATSTLTLTHHCSAHSALVLKLHKPSLWSALRAEAGTNAQQGQGQADSRASDVRGEVRGETERAHFNSFERSAQTAMCDNAANHSLTAVRCGADTSLCLPALLCHCAPVLLLSRRDVLPPPVAVAAGPAIERRRESHARIYTVTAAPARSTTHRLPTRRVSLPRLLLLSCCVVPCCCTVRGVARWAARSVTRVARRREERRVRAAYMTTERTSATQPVTHQPQRAVIDCRE